MDYQTEYNYHLSQLPKAYRSTMTLEKYIKLRTYEAVYKMNSRDLSS